MPAVNIDFGNSPSARLATIGLKLPMTRGVLALSDATYFEPPTSVQTHIASGSLLQIGAFCSISGGRIGNLKVGRYCSFAPDLVTGAHEHPVDWLTSSRATYVPELHDWAKFLAPDRLDEIRAGRIPFKHSCPPTTIGNDVWIGQGVFLKSGVTIGDGAIIGARSVVVSDIPAYSIAVGSPAKVKRLRFPEKTVERLQKLRWWRFSIFDLVGIPFDRIDEAIDQVEARIADGAIQEYAPQRITVDALKDLFEPVAA